MRPNVEVSLEAAFEVETRDWRCKVRRWCVHGGKTVVVRSIHPETVPHNFGSWDDLGNISVTISRCVWCEFPSSPRDVDWRSLEQIDLIPMKV